MTSARLYPIVIQQCRYSGVYEGGLWFALADPAGKREEFEEEMLLFDEYLEGDDCDAVDFWGSAFASDHFGLGATPNDALFNLLLKSGKDLDVGLFEALGAEVVPPAV